MCEVCRCALVSLGLFGWTAAKRGRGGGGVGGLTTLFYDIEGGVGEIVVFEQVVVGRAGERAHEDWMVLW